MLWVLEDAHYAHKDQISPVEVKDNVYQNSYRHLNDESLVQKRNAWFLEEHPADPLNGKTSAKIHLYKHATEDKGEEQED